LMNMLAMLALIPCMLPWTVAAWVRITPTQIRVVGDTQDSWSSKDEIQMHLYHGIVDKCVDWCYPEFGQDVELASNEIKKLDNAIGAPLWEDMAATLVLEEADTFMNDFSTKVIVSKERVNSFHAAFRSANVTSFSLKYQFGFDDSNFASLLKERGFTGWVVNLISDQLCIDVIDLFMWGPSGRIARKLGASVAAAAYKEAQKRGLTKNGARILATATKEGVEEGAKTGMEKGFEALGDLLDVTEFCLVEMIDQGTTNYEVHYLVEWVAPKASSAFQLVAWLHLLAAMSIVF